MNHDRRRVITLFLGVFSYVIATGCLMQLVILPHVFPGLHAGDGLLRGQDPIGFHHEAVELMERMRLEGWSAWSFRPDGRNTPPGIMAVIYYLSAPHPYVLLPLNGTLWGLTAVVWWLTLSRLFPAIKGWTMLGALLVIGLPSSFTWTTQFHKDLFTIPGCSLILYSMIRGITWGEAPGNRFKEITLLGTAVFSGTFLVWIGRPYLTQLAIAGMLGALSLAVLGVLARRVSWASLATLVFVVSLTMIASAVGNRWSGNLGVHLDLARASILETKEESKDARQTGTIREEQGPPQGTVHDSPSDVTDNKTGLLTLLNRKAGLLGNIRHGYCVSEATMGSAIDCAQPMKNMSDLLAYLPRATQIALFSPFPDTWFAKGKTPGGTQMRVIAGAETLVAYIIFAGAFLLILTRRVKPTLPMAMAAIFLLTPALIQTLANPNVGTLYRMRYGFWTGLIAIALCLIISYWLERRNAPGKP